MQNLWVIKHATAIILAARYHSKGSCNISTPLVKSFWKNCEKSEDAHKV